MTRLRCRKPGLWRLPDPAMSGRSAENDSSLHQPRSFVAHGNPLAVCGPGHPTARRGRRDRINFINATNFTGNPGVVDKPRGIPGRCPRAEVTAGEMEEGVGLKAVSQLLWPDRDPEVWFSLEENHEKAYHFGLHQLRNCPVVMVFVCGVRLGLAQAAGAECRQARPPTLICRRAGEAVRVRRAPTATAARARSG